MDRAEGGKPEGGKVGDSQLLAAVYSTSIAASRLACRGDTVARRVRLCISARCSAGGGSAQATIGPVALWCARDLLVRRGAVNSALCKASTDSVSLHAAGAPPIAPSAPPKPARGPRLGSRNPGAGAASGRLPWPSASTRPEAAAERGRCLPLAEAGRAPEVAAVQAVAPGAAEAVAPSGECPGSASGMLLGGFFGLAVAALLPGLCGGPTTATVLSPSMLAMSSSLPASQLPLLMLLLVSLQLMLGGC